MSADAELARPDATRVELARLRHDLRTPLAVVAGFADLLAGERPLSEEERRLFASRIAEAAGDLRRILDERQD